ncbi:hypothetical protein V6N13_089747 [Hibiscus sabdariffa]|uniref:Uncharacterized protein n=1 Tax=Hibiscus sabdariffa TaxID=183260 RepID=A0ABR2QIY3_9ROSI
MNSLGVVSLLIILIVAGNCSCQEEFVYGQCKKDHDCAKMCAPGCKPSCLVGSGLCRFECTNNARKITTAAKIAYGQCKKDHDCAKIKTMIVTQWLHRVANRIANLLVTMAFVFATVSAT